MDWQFGYNCAHLVPVLDKCRVKIERYNQRPDLLATRVLTTRQLLIYSGWLPPELIDRVERGDVFAYRVKKPLHPARDGWVRYRFPCAWKWDDCGMARDSGGVCEWYEPIDGPHISCLADLRHWDTPHPNMVNVPPDETWRQVDDVLRGMVEEMTAAEAGEEPEE